VHRMRAPGAATGQVRLDVRRQSRAVPIAVIGG